MRCTVIRLLKTTVHVESRNRNWSARKTSPTPASPACVATRICSIYFVFGGAAYRNSDQYLLHIAHDSFSCFLCFLCFWCCFFALIFFFLFLSSFPPFPVSCFLFPD